ncbi:hypothetical protein HAX39_24965, partial [Citrobacter freundii]|nr:hypothetical protein [Citrobacter freundii]
MSDFNALMQDVDDILLSTFNVSNGDDESACATLWPGESRSKKIQGVFDGPDATVKLKTGGRIQSTAPTLFVKLHDIGELKEKDELLILGDSYWVEKIGPDDNGSCTLTLGHG